VLAELSKRIEMRFITFLSGFWLISQTPGRRFTHCVHQVKTSKHHTSCLQCRAGKL